LEPEAMLEVWSQMRGPAPSLEILRLRKKDRAPIYSIPPGKLFDGHLPRLKHLCLGVLPEDWPDYLSGLTKLEVSFVGLRSARNPTPRQIWETLSKCPNLEQFACESLHFDMDGDSDKGLNDEMPPVCLDSLQRLSIHALNAGCIDTFMELIETPALQELYLAHSWPGLDFTPQPSHPHKFSMPLPALQKMSLFGAKFTEDVVLQMLQQAPNLTVLGLTLTSILDSLSAPLDDSSWVCPRLQELNIKAYSDLTPRRIVRLVKSRKMEQSGDVPVSPIRRLTIEDPCTQMGDNKGTAKFLKDNVEQVDGWWFIRMLSAPKRMSLMQRFG
jgi:hypothetical protein